MTAKALRAVVFVISLWALVLSGLVLVREYTQVATLTQMGDMWSFLALSDEPQAVFIEVDEDDFFSAPLPSVGDTLLEIAGLPATHENYFAIFNTETEPGTTIDLTFKSGDEIHEARVVTRSIPTLLSVQVVALFALRLVFTLAIIVVGFWAFSRRPDSPAVRVLCLLCYSLALAMLSATQAIAPAYAKFQLPVWAVYANNVFGVFAPALWLKLQLLFPRVNPAYSRRRVLLNVLVYGSAMAMSAYTLLGGDMPLVLRRAYVTVFLSLGFMLLARNYARAHSFVERRQTKLVLFGSIPGLGILIIHTWVVFFATDWFRGLSSSVKLAVFNVETLLLLLVPASFAVALGRYRLLEVEGRVKRGTRLLAVNALLLVAFFLVVSAIGELLLTNIGIESRTPTIALVLLLALGFAPAERRIFHIIENRIYPERVRLRALLTDFLQSRQISETGRGFWKDLEGKLLEGIGADKIYPVLLRQSGNGAWCADECDLVPFELSEGFFSSVGAAKHPLLLDEIIASKRVEMADDVKDWLEARHVAVIIPLTTQNGLVGFLFLTHKVNGEDYTAEELRLLDSLAAQIAIVAENVELLEDKFEKQRLEEQLEIARSVQEGLLPKTLPQIPGIELGAKIRFCLDVAGDYYDVIPQSSGGILLAVGDVSGKGVGAALLMANLQAALRAVKDIGRPFTDVIANINTHVYENTAPELFITLFVALVEPEAGKVCFINAGHNAPILLRKNGNVERLNPTGLLLGFLPEAEYRQQTTEMKPGDTLLMFTDGVSEAMNSSDEEFGEERLLSVMYENRDRPLPDLLDIVEEKVRVFRGKGSFEDDFTLLAVRLNRDLTSSQS